MPRTARWIAQAVGGTLVGLGPDVVVLDVVKDSTEATSGSMFVAVAGEHVDGHDFAPAALDGGSVAVLSARSLRDPVGNELPCIVVDDPVAALGRLAAAVRKELDRCTVVAITGSSGKTSTKDLVAAVLSTIGPTISPHGSFNTEIGVPLTILRADESTRFLVLEMGMRGLGHIRYLADMSQPDIGVVLNVGSAHLGVLGSQHAIAAAKEELVEALGSSGIAVLNLDDERVAAMASRSAVQVISFGESHVATVAATDVRLDDQAHPSFTLEDRRSRPVRSHRVSLKLRGRHFVSNALAAATVGLTAGANVEQVAEALSGATVNSKWRMEVSETASGVTVINDAYNANPDSMRAALSVLAETACEGRRWLVLGEMRELGSESEVRHEEVGRAAVDLGIDRLVCVGEGTLPAYRAALEAGTMPESVVCVDGVDEALQFVASSVRSGDVVLVKASRSVGLERIAIGLVEGVTT